ncbi:MAG: Hsp70 family protein [Labilithrix sp.]|nr:Hsp70 family protein [Labilithrix sp.]
MSVAIGIDLGTTNTVVAAVVDGVAVTLEDDQGRRLLPSVVSFHPSSTVLVGEPARERRLIDPENTIFSVKPLLGRSWDSDEVQSAKARFPFRLVQGTKNSTMILARDVAYALPEISAFVLRRAKSIAEAALGQPVDRAVITVPANFNDLQRASTKIAGKLAGLDVMRILNEPTAAALAYGQSISKAEKIGVYDLGGGTFDVTLLDLTGSVFEVLATAGDTALGGDDIDRVLAEKIALDVIKRFNVDPRTNPASAARLGFVAEELKKELSTAYQAQREITGIGYHEGGHPITTPFVMTRDELEALARPLVERTIAVARQSIEIIGLSPREFDRVILVGGSTRIPLVARMVEQLFGQPPHLKVNPDEVVALGAAIQAHALNRSKAAHKRRSAHDQLAKAQPKSSGEQVPTRPPDADPILAPADVPRAPALPTNLGAPPAVPEFLSFNKAPAVISFSDVPGAMPASPQAAPPKAPAKPPPVPRQPPPLPRPRAQTLPMEKVPIEPPRPAGAPSAPKVPAAAPASAPNLAVAPPGSAPRVPAAASAASPLQSRGASDHASPLLDARASTRPIEGMPARSPVEDAPLGPKPARRSVSPSEPAMRTPDFAAPDLYDGGGPGIASAHGSHDIVAAPELDLALPSGPPAARAGTSGGIGSLVMSNEFFQELELDAGPALTPERFQQGSAITTSASTPLLIDVTPLSLGVETAGGYADVLIPANSPVPCEKTRTFLTASDGQTIVSIRVAQGESSRFAANTRLGDLELSGLRSARRGEVKVAVTFELDADGILNVRARDPDTGRETTATMRLLGTSTDAADIGEMAARQARHEVA